MSSPLLGVRLLLLDAASVDEHDAFDAGVAGAGRRAKLMPRSELASEKVWATTSPSEVQLAVADSQLGDDGARVLPSTGESSCVDVSDVEASENRLGAGDILVLADIGASGV